MTEAEETVTPTRHEVHKQTCRICRDIDELHADLDDC